MKDIIFKNSSNYHLVLQKNFAFVSEYSHFIINVGQEVLISIISILIYFKESSEFLRNNLEKIIITHNVNNNYYFY